MSNRHASNASRIARVNYALKAAKEFLLPFKDRKDTGEPDSLRRAALLTFVDT